MKIGVLSDIHGNSYALQKVLGQARKEKVQKLYILGDFVGYYYDPDKVLEMLKEWDYDFIRGNHEDLLSCLKENKISELEVVQKFGNGHKTALQKLSEAQQTQLINAPNKKKVIIDGVRILLCHGSPYDAGLYLYPDTEKEILDKCDVSDMDFVMIGHSHYSFIYKNKKSILINVGSVGQARNIGGMAYWLLMNTKNRTLEVKATFYDVTPLVKQIESMDPGNHYLKDVLFRGAG